MKSMPILILNKAKVDEIFQWKRGEGIPGRAGCCRIRIYCNNLTVQESDCWVVIASEIEANKGKAITNCVEQLFPKVCQHYGINREHTTWVEHYNEESYPDRERSEEYSKVTIEQGKNSSWTYLSESVLKELLVKASG